MFANAGLSKADVQDWLIEHSGRTVGELRRAGKGGSLRPFGATDFNADAIGDEEFHRVLSARTQIPVIVAGAKNAAISMVVRIFGEWSGQSVPVAEKRR
jgi:hypothetical protein